ncbi:MAG TPA: EAL domain-containing protein [Gammaproteobacteria bacterium]
MTEALRVGHILHEELLTCDPELPLHEAAARMRAARCSSILVVSGETALGIWTEHDALAVDLAEPAALEQPISALMSSPVRTIDRHATLDELGRRFDREQIRHLLVLGEHGRFAGIVSQTDVVLNYGLERYLQLSEVGTALSGPVLQLPPALPVAEAAARMRAAGVDAAVVTGSGEQRPGILTERDLVRCIAGRSSDARAGDLASRPLLSVARNCSLLRARDLSVQKGVRHLAVSDADHAIVGLLSFADILHLLEHDHVSQLEQVLREREEALIASQRSLRLAQQVIDASQDGVVVTDADGVIEAVNPAFTRLTGYRAIEALGKTPAILKSGRHDKAFYAAMWHALRTGGHWQGEVWNRRKNGEIYPEWLTITTLVDEDGGERKYAGVFSDISERKENEERIRSLAYYDPLTALPNRRLFHDRLSVALPQMRRHGQRLAVLFIDLDLFKRINDTLGHSIGDQVLMEMADRLRECVRDGDTVSRMGGDEFTVIQPDIHSADDALRLARRIVDSIRRPFAAGGRELYVTTSIGIALYPGDGETPEELIKNADTAMYRAKDLGRNSHQLYAQSMNAESFERLTMESHLRQALERDQLLLNYQVKVNLLENRTSGVEALLRWQHPEFGLVPPAQFVPLAEGNGLIVPIGTWVLREACRQAYAWLSAGLPGISVAVNFSPRQMQRIDLVETVIAALQDTGLPAERLEIELTESVLMEHMDEVAPKLHRLRAEGVRISIDDFGTGYSSLAYLKRLPIDKLKIDTSFVRDVPEDADDAEIVAAIVAMAHRLGLQVVAEGVEKPEQVEFLRGLGCDEIQGYLVSRPLSAENIGSLLERHLLPELAG